MSDRQLRTSSGFVVDEYYRASGKVDESAPPGEFPYRRGFAPQGFRDEFWAWEMYAGFGSAEDANRRYRFLLDNGATGGVSIALDLPTQMGFDSDHALARGEVGRIGVALDAFSDVEDLFAGIDLAEAGHVFSTANCIGPIMYAWVLHFCETHDVNPTSFRLQIQNDPIKEYYARGTNFLPIEPAVRLATDVVTYSHIHTPNWLPISVSGSHMKQAGASPAQEAAFTIANAISYMKDVERKGTNVGAFNPTLELHFCTDMDFFEEIAKYRAVRQAWSEILVARFGASVTDELAFRLHAATSGLPLTAQQPHNNIARITLQALAQILGGVEATRTASWDEALAIPTEAAAAVSLRINQIIAHETGIPYATDRFGGSYYVEHLTDRIYQVIMDEVDRIDRMGGAVVAASNGYYAGKLAEGAYAEQKAVDSGERVVVGVNKYVDDSPVSYPRFNFDREAEPRQITRIQNARATRDEARTRQALEDCLDAATGDDNVVPSVLEAVRSGATLGEICDVWRSAFGVHRESVSYL